MYEFRPASQPDTPDIESGGLSCSPGMALAALVLSILAVIFCVIIYISLPLAAMAIVLALLSRGSGRLAGRARTGVVIACISIAVSLFLTGAGVLYIWRTPELRDYVKQLYEYYSGYEEEDPSLPQPEELPYTAPDEPDPGQMI